jgi:hypothetical protein
MKTGWVSSLKMALVPKGIKPRAVAFGLYRNLTFQIDLRSQTQLYLGLWERETYSFISLAAGRCNWAIDVGAGRGELSVYLLRCPSIATVHAAEPQPSELDFVREHVKLNNIASTKTLITTGKFIGCGSADIFERLDSLHVDSGVRGFIKIDVDGAEMDVLQSGERLFSQGKIDLLLETHSTELEKKSLEFLERHGFRCEIIRNAWWRAVLPEQRPIPHNRWLWATKG